MPPFGEVGGGEHSALCGQLAESLWGGWCMEA